MYATVPLVLTFQSEALSVSEVDEKLNNNVSQDVSIKVWRPLIQCSVYIFVLFQFPFCFQQPFRMGDRDFHETANRHRHAVGFSPGNHQLPAASSTKPNGTKTRRHQSRTTSLPLSIGFLEQKNTARDHTDQLSKRYKSLSWTSRFGGSPVKGNEVKPICLPLVLFIETPTPTDAANQPMSDVILIPESRPITGDRNSFRIRRNVRVELRLIFLPREDTKKRNLHRKFAAIGLIKFIPT